MTPGLLDLNDSNLQLWHGDTHVQSPGYALLQGDAYLFGAPARAAARLHPRSVNTRFWWRLNTEALQPALGSARHTADLAHAHLMQLHEQGGKPGELLLAVPGSMGRDQLGLLLGIVQQCPFRAVGLVHRSVALGSLYGSAGRVFHLEIQLHQALITTLASSGNKLELQDCVPLPGCGMLQLQERLVEVIATEFVRQTRFDPRRKADTEQILYDALPRTLHALRNSANTNVDVNGYTVRISAQQLQAAGARLFESAATALKDYAQGDRIIADPLAGLLPGLASALPGLELLQGEDVRDALLQHGPQLAQDSEALSFIKTLPCLGVKGKVPTANIAPATPAEQQQPTSIPPTHLLRDGIARPLQDAGTELANGWVLYRDSSGWLLRGSGTPVMVNGDTWREGQVLAAGDTLATNGGEPAMLIEVRNAGDD